MQHSEHPKTRPVARLITGLLAILSMTTAHGAGVPASQDVDWLSRLAHGGDAGAQLQLGLAYKEGRYGLAPDQHAARYWLDSAARGGYSYAAKVENMPAGMMPNGTLSTTTIPFSGKDFPGLTTLSAIWHIVEESSPAYYSREALMARAKGGDPVAEYQLGMHYRDGAWAVEPDAEQSQAWLQRAAVDGNKLAAQALAETRQH